MEQSYKCVHCEQREMEDQSDEQMSFAVLLALVPLVVMTLFGSIGLI
ncbi:hypothetical protein BMS3Abin15_00732 [bacterium BMS3Abin15]|nr:hypothetical protein BMS3Abin15_00732 [bacterium BMS3Abin15]